MHMLLFTDWVPDIELRSNYGWSLIIFVSLFCAYNMLFIISFGFKGLYLIAKKYLIKFGCDLKWDHFRRKFKFKHVKKNQDKWRIKKSRWNPEEKVIVPNQTVVI